MVLQLVKGYETLKPIVERIMEKPTSSDVNKLRGILQDTAPQALDKLQDFILAHLMKNVIDPTVNPELKCSILQCVHTVLENSRISSAESALQLLSFLFSQVYDAKVPTMIRHVPEELKLNVVRCALACTQNISQDIRLEMYEADHVPALSLVVYTCVTLAKLEMMQDLRITSMEVIMSVCLIPPIGSPDTSDPQDRTVIADAIQFLLPGIVSNLSYIVRGPITQGSKISATAVRTLGGVIALVMEDYDWGNSEQSADSIVALVQTSVTENKPDVITNAPNPETPSSHDPEAVQRTLKSFKGRTRDWRKSCATNLTHVLEKIGKLKTHAHWRVRKEVVWVSSLIMARCPQSLYHGLSPLLNALLHLQGDDQIQVHQLCLQNITQIQALFAARACKSFQDLVQENMYDLLTKLPRLVQEDCGENTPTLLSLLAGYIELLGSDLKLMFHVAVHLQRFSLSVLQALVLDTSFVVLTPEYFRRELKSEMSGGFRAPWIRFEHCGDESAIIQLTRLVNALSAPPSSGACEIIGRQLLVFISKIPSIANEAALFLNQLLKTVQGDQLHHVANVALDIYVGSNLYNDSNKMSLSQSQKNIVKICILTEGIGCCIKAMRPKDVHSSLLRAIYPAVERAGSANYLVSMAGLQALSILASCTGHADDLVGFLNANIDYLSHSISIRLRRPHENPAVFDALTLLLRHTSQSTLPGIRDIVSDVLLRNCDAHQESYAEAHLRVFHSFAGCMEVWLKGEEDVGILHEEFGDDNQPVFIETTVRRECLNWRSVHQLLDYHASLVQAEKNFEMEDHEQAHLTEEQLPEGNWKTETREGEKHPPEVLLLESVLQRSLHNINSSDINVQFLALRTVALGMEVLSTFKDVLLPLGHQTWAPLVGRLRHDQSPLIFRTAFGLLCTMAETCQDFLRPRIVKEVFPELCEVLKSSSVKSHLQDKNSAYRFSQLYKLQKAILSRVGHLCLHLQLEGPDFRNLLIAALPYLSCYQPRPLQKYCFNFLSLLKTLDDDLVWWNVATHWGNESLTCALKVPMGNTDFSSETPMLLEQKTS